MTRKIICLCSGGPDSFVLVHFLKKLNYQIKILFINYGQLSNLQENKAVQNIAKILEIKDFIKVDLKNFGNFFSNSLVNTNEFLDDYFPGRNLLFLNIAASLCYEQKIPEIGIGIINGSRTFPDCSSEFFAKMEDCFNIAFNYYIGIQSPLEAFSKIEIFKYLIKFDLPIEITYSCQKGGKEHCNKCPSCIERNNAIKNLKF